MKHLLTLLVVLPLAGCVQENNPRNISLGDVTLGQQLIDLKAAYEADAVSEAEYEQIKENLIAASRMCAAEEDEESDDSWFF